MAASSMHLFPLFLFVTLSVKVSQTQEVSPKNAAGREGDSLELNCTSNEQGIRWEYDPLDNRDSVIVYQNGVVDDRYEAGSRLHNIIIKNLEYEIAGKYSCSTTDSQVRQRFIQVAAASKLQCHRENENAQREGDTPELQCSSAVSAFSDLRAKFSWFRDGEPVEGWDKVVQTTPSQGAPETKSFSYNFTVTNKDHQVPFECRLSFEYVGNGGPEADKSNPDYEDSCELSFDVNFFPTDTRIYPSSHDEIGGWINVEEGDVFNCTARGNPSVSYTWEQINGEIFQIGPELVVTEEMVNLGDMVVINCTATNTIQGQDGTDTDQVRFYAYARDGAANNAIGPIVWIWSSAVVLNFAIH